MPLRDGDDAPLNLEAPSSPDHERAPSLVVGVGASAGGLEALERLLRALPGDTGMAFVVAQHLAPDFKSMMHEILRRFTSMTTVPVEGTVVMRPDTIYLLTPRQEMVIDGLRLISTDRPADRVHSHPIDTLLRSLARTWGERGVAIVLSGTGSDGSAGAAEVRDVGGLVIAQSPESCRFDGMPRSVIDAGCVDAVLTPEDMAATLVAYAEGGRSAGIPLAPARDQVGEGAPRIFERLRAAYGVDFDDYKPGTVTRRIERRAALHPEHLDVVEYARRVEQDDDELDLLYKDLLIGVTRFFRDPEAFAVLADRVIPDLVARAGPEEEVRIWVAACHTGEEAYSLAILFFEAFAAIGAAPRVKVLATDIRPEALQVAGEGVYPESSFVDMPVELRDRYFVPQPDGAWRVTASLRRALLFSNHNLLKAAPFTRIDLLSCRNMLIYLEGTAQRRAIAAFHASLRADSCLFLGPSEGLGELGAEFGVVDRHWKIFTKLHESRLPQDHRRPPSHGSRVAVPPAPGLNGARLGRAYDLLLSAFVPSGVLVNDRHEAVHVFGDANRYLSPPSGRVSADVLPMVRGHLRAAMMAGLRHAQQRSTPVEYRDVTHEVDGERVLLNMTIRPLIDPAQSNRYYMVTLEEVRPIDAPPVAGGEPPEADELAHVSALERELQQARESLQSTIEALETGNEELQATNEELLASNEEIQSTNEELHSVNMELYSVNAEHEVKIQELNAVTSDLNNLIASTRIATVFVGTDLSVRLFTPEATRVFPLQPQDIGRDLRHFRPVEPDDRLIDDIQRVLTTHAAIEHNVAWSDGRTMLRRITAYQDNNHTTAGAVLTYIDISETARLAVQLQRSRARLAAMVESNPNGMLVADDSGDILMVNPSLERMFGYGVDDLLGAPVELLLPEGSRVRHVALRGGYERQPTARPMGAGRELSGRRRDGTLFPIEVSLSAFQDGGRTLMQAMVVDISERRAAEVAIAASQATNARLASIVASSDDAIVGADPDGQITTWNPGAERLLGRTADQAIGLSLASLFVDPAEAARARSGPSLGAEALRHDTSLRHGDGSLVDASVVLSTIRDPRGQAIGLSLIAHDARERVRAAARREQLQRELEDQVAQRTHELQALNERLAEALARAESATRAKSSFLANMSHEIRTPLNAIIGTSYLVKHANATPEQQEQLTRIERAASHLVEIISNILDLSKIETGKVSLETIELSIDTISRDVATMCESAARARDLEIRVDLAPMPWRLRGDVTRLRQAWLNYAANAVKFTDAGDITLRTRVVEERADRVCIRFEVEDTGIGVDREAIERLFAAFEQADSSTTRRYGGTGLGLAITRGLAELMDGAVGVDANPSGGSTFWFTAWLDRVNDVVAADVITDPEGGRRQLAEEFGGAQILLVEDDPINRTVAAQLLRLAELEPVCANNGREAVERAREARYAMVLMDMHMPEMDGLTATREIRHLEGWARVPIVAVTANASTEARQRCRSAGMNDLLTKPVEAPRLYATMLGWLRRAR